MSRRGPKALSLKAVRKKDNGCMRGLNFQKLRKKILAASGSLLSRSFFVRCVYVPVHDLV